MTLRTRAAKSIVLAAAAAILASCALLACFGGHDTITSRNEVRVKVTDVGFDGQSNTHFVMLADQNGRRGMPIMIGDDEARTIMLELNGIKPDRPLTADLLRNVIQQTGNQVDRVVIGDMRNQVFYAQIYLDHDRYVVDSRPSDAIALAVGTQVPIYINGEIFDASAQTLDSAPPQFAALDGITVQDLTPAIASYFGVAPSSGVLVADITQPAASALKRGDIITQLDGRPVPNPAAFKEEGQQSSGAPFKFTLLRDGHSMTVALNRAVTH
jgi:bifunctional DNase/RNase